MSTPSPSQPSRAARRWRYWWPPAVWAALIFTASSLSPPSKPLPFSFSGLDKIAHLGVFAVLALLLYRALRLDAAWTPRRAALWAMASAILYGALDEGHQWFTPGRSVEWGDWLADALGALAATIFVRRLLPARYR